MANDINLNYMSFDHGPEVVDLTGDPTDDEQVVESDPSPGSIAGSDSDCTVTAGSKDTATEGYDTTDTEHYAKSDPSSGYLAGSESDYKVVGGPKNVVKANRAYSSSYYSEYEEHLDGALTNEELDKKYPGTNVQATFIFLFTITCNPVACPYNPTRSKD